MFAPLQVALGRGREETEQAGRVRSVLVEQNVGIDDVFLGLGHLLDAPRVNALSADAAGPSGTLLLDVLREEKAVFRTGNGLLTNHALGQQTGERFLVVDQAEFLEDPSEIARIKQMQNRMFDPPNILVYT